MYRSLVFLIVALVAVVVAGCANPASSSPINNTPAANESPLPAAGSESPVVTPSTEGELPSDIAANAVAWLATQSNLSATDLRLVNAERAEWSDGCFGLGGPAESCLAAITPGWRITFEANGEQYEVRTDEAGTNFRVAPKAS